MTLRNDDTQREDDDGLLYRRLVKDVCYLYHELGAYRSIMGDLDYANDYPLEYWTLLNRIDTGQPDDRFVRSGILVLMLSMANDALDGQGSRLDKHYETAVAELERFIPEDEEMLRLADAVSLGFRLIQENAAYTESFEDENQWAYDTFVRRYFESNAQ